MHRRDFLSRSTVAAAAAYLGLGVSPASTAFAQAPAVANKPKKNTFKLKYGPHFGMFKAHAGEDLLDQLRFMADVGFTAFEDNGLMKRPVEVQEAIGKTLTQLNMTMGVFVIDAGDNWKVSYATGKPEFKEPFLKACRDAVETAKRVNARWATVVPGYFERNLPIGIQTGHVIDILKRGAEILAPHNLTMVLEPLSDNPDLFLRTSDQTYMICRAVGSPACKILFDMYHMQRNEGRDDRAHRLGVGRDRVFPDRRRARSQGTGHGRDELPEHLQAHPPEGAGGRQDVRDGDGARQLRARRRGRARAD